MDYLEGRKKIFKDNEDSRIENDEEELEDMDDEDYTD